MDRDEELSLFEMERTGGRGVEDPVHDLKLEVVIPGTQRSDLAKLTLLRAPADFARVGPRNRSVLLDVRKLLGFAISSLHGPVRTAAHDLIQLIDREVESALRADARRHGAVEIVRKGFETAAEPRLHEARRVRPHAARDVEADAPGRDDPSLLGIEGGHAADRKAVPPVGVRHRPGRADDAGKGRHVPELLAHFLVERVDQLAARVDSTGDAHAARSRKLPDVRLDLEKRGSGHDLAPFSDIHDTLGDPLALLGRHLQRREGGAFRLHGARVPGGIVPFAEGLGRDEREERRSSFLERLLRRGAVTPDADVGSVLEMLEAHLSRLYAGIGDGLMQMRHRRMRRPAPRCPWVPR